VDKKQRIIPEIKELLEKVTVLVETLQVIATDIKLIVEKVK